MIKNILQYLADLQYIDDLIHEVDNRRGLLPQEIDEYEIAQYRLNNNISNAKTNHENLVKEQRSLTVFISDAEARLAKYEKQQYLVRNNREYNTLIKEIEVTKEQIKESKQRLIEIESSYGDYEATLTKQEEEHKELLERIQESRQKLEKLNKQNENELLTLNHVRDEICKKIEKRYLNYYERFRKAGGGYDKIVVAMEKGSVFGSNLPPQRRADVQAKNNIIIDEHTGKIIVDEFFFGEAKKRIADYISNIG